MKKVKSQKPVKKKAAKKVVPVVVTETKILTPPVSIPTSF